MDLFSHENVRDSQNQLMETITEALKKRKHVIAHAPTGLGKTAATLCPALAHAIENDLTVFFLTSRHTQHKIVLDTINLIKKRHNVNFLASSLIGKRWMCGQDSADSMRSSDFTEFCKALVENDTCEFFTNARGKSSLVANKVLADLKKKAPQPTEDVILECIQEKICPYEMSLLLAERSKVIVTDYFYLFHPHIRDAFFAKTKKKLSEAIIIVDEAHNLPARVRDVLSVRLSSRVLKLAIDEANKFGLDDYAAILQEILSIVETFAKNLQDGQESSIKQGIVLSELKKIKPVGELVEELNVGAEVVRLDKKSSHIGRIANALEQWSTATEGYARFVSKDDDVITLSLCCLDPALITRAIFDQCHSAILMSGTLTPTNMYADLFGIHPDDCIEKVFPCPFEEKNRRSLIVPKTTTRFASRSDEQFKNIGIVCATIANRIPGCVMLFFPSYDVRNRVYSSFVEHYEKTVFQEMQGLTKTERQDMLDRFSGYKNSGAAMLAVASGSFGEGIDLPGVLKGVIVVGLPLEKPDLETTERIQYYDLKFGSGWEYGYILPAMTRCIQNAGRCIRTESDRGVIAFVDERFAWPRYKKYFPPDWKTSITTDVYAVEEFFDT